MRLNMFLPYRSRARRPLRLLGGSWESSPLRRIVQALALGLFVILFFHVCWPYGSMHHAEAMAARERIDAEAFLLMDPLVGISASLATREATWALAWGGAVLAVCLLLPRGFCGYLCPLGTLIDLFDRAVGRHVVRGRTLPRRWWSHLRYALLAAVLVAAAGGVLVAGFVAAIPLLTRGLVNTAGPVQLGLARDWYLVPPMHAGHLISIALFALVFALSLLGPRFWCRCVCPTGALLSIANLLRLTDRRVKDTCIACGKCVKACSFDAIRADFTTRAVDCTFCQSCGGVCPPGAIEFTGRWRAPAPPVGGSEAVDGSLAAATVDYTRRAVLAGGLGAGGAVLGGAAILAAGSRPQTPVVRAPGSVPEEHFGRMCVRCGLCIKACPFNVLQPLGLGAGFDGLWTPHVVADWAGCDETCTNCGQVCPTGAIRALPLEEKRVARMGLAVVNERTCLPHAGRGPCDICEKECRVAKYRAIDFIRVPELDAEGRPIPDSGYRAPWIPDDRKCVGCGLCQSRCHHVNVVQKGLLAESAIIIHAGGDREDRLLDGSYLALRKQERQAKAEARRKLQKKGNDFYIP